MPVRLPQPSRFLRIRKRNRRPHVIRGRASLAANFERLEERTLLAAGVLDSSFGTGGFVKTEVIPDQVYYLIADLAVSPSDGKIIAVGDDVIAQYQADGTLDQTFGTQGLVRIQ